MITSLANLFLYLSLRQLNIASAGGTNVDVKVNVPIIEGCPTPAVELRDRAAGGISFLDLIKAFDNAPIT